MMRLIRIWWLGGRDLTFLWYALRHEHRPPWLLPAAIILGLFALEPLNFAIPLLGIVDDVVLLPFLLSLLTKSMPTRIRVDFERRSIVR